MRWWETLLVMAGIFVIAPALAFILLHNLDQPTIRFLDRLERMTVRPISDWLAPYGALLFLLGLPIVLLAATAAHEFGHFLAGTLVGLDPYMLAIRHIVVTFNGGKVRFGLRKGEKAGGFMAMGIQRVRRLRRRLAFFVAGGPLADLSSLLVSLIAIRFGLLQALPSWAKADIIFFVLVSGGHLIATFCPPQVVRGNFNDGARLIMIGTSRLKTRRWFALYALGLQQRRGMRPKELKSSWIKAATYANDRTRDAFGGFWLAYKWAFDREEWVKAGGYLEACLESAGSLPSDLRELLISEAAVFHAWFRRDAEKAQKWFNLLQKPGALPPLVLVRVNVALRWAQNRPEAVLAYWNDGLALIRTLPAGSRERLEVAWQEWKAQLDKRSTPDTTSPQTEPT